VAQGNSQFGANRRAGPVEWPLTLDCDPVALALVGPVVPQGEMLGAAVVPKGDGVLGPAEAHLKFRPLLMAVEKIQQRLAFGGFQSVDAGGEAGVHIRRLTARLGMGAHHRMLGAGIDLAGVVDPAFRVAATVEVLGFVRRGEA